MALWHSIIGSLDLEILCADPAAFLSELHKRGIPLIKVLSVDDLTVELQISRKEFKTVKAFAKKRGVQWKVIRKKGLYWTFLNFCHRPVLLVGLGILLLLTAYLPTKILFFNVEGNDSIPDRQITELASQAGLNFGTNRRDVRSEKVKNALLKAIPELEWVGINTSGCVATISVRQRQSVQLPSENPPVSSIVATKDGIIQNIVVTAGSPAVKIDQQVIPGQVLISGYTDCGLTVRAQQAKGEVYAQTTYELTFVLPVNDGQNGDASDENQKFSMIFGKNRINFFESSGILDTGCVKMYEEKYVTLPGCFVLPVAIVIERNIRHTANADEASMEATLQQTAERYLKSQMVAGSILSKEETITQEDGYWQLKGKYVCLEMIGREQSEGIIKP